MERERARSSCQERDWIGLDRQGSGLLARDGGVPGVLARDGRGPGVLARVMEGLELAD